MTNVIVCFRTDRDYLHSPLDDSLKEKLVRLGGWFLIILTIVAFLDGPMHSTTASAIVWMSSNIKDLTISTLAIILGVTLIKHR